MSRGGAARAPNDTSKGGPLLIPLTSTPMGREEKHQPRKVRQGERRKNGGKQKKRGKTKRGRGTRRYERGKGK